MIFHRLLTQETVIQLIDQIDREQHLLFYSYLTQRRDSAQFIGQFVNHQLTAVLAYTSELSFPAFSFYCANNQQVYFHELITFTRTTLQLDEHVICGTILCDRDLQLFQSYGLITGNPQRFLTMKHGDQAKLLEDNRAERIKEEEYSEAIDFIRKGGMRFFTRSEIKGCPFLGIKDGRDFVAVGGFHFYDRQLVEIGNIITKPEYRGRGLGKLLTSQLTWMGKQLSADVYLGVMKENQPAVHVYESLGFETTAELSIVDFTLSCHEFTSKS
ncbi:GNAT family N-acetyltransferase [Halalkalibacter okhensis]|uniref:GCN5 family acetyltransferase n=1 Tax=Halalkalibacter okhensis TaxID=333138 RepID=A0A0B0IIX7_9BACI|nr:GNAT family N-acetyltransferase [Halalkalibacter okhensis]KHF41250.1 GCN5 family acetyltransferase [Halalkalibacter okhensis]